MRIVSALIRRPSNLIVPTGDYSAEVTQVALQKVKSGKNAGRLAFFVTFTADVGEESPVNGLAEYLLDPSHLPRSGTARRASVMSLSSGLPVRACSVATRRSRSPKAVFASRSSFLVPK